MNKRLKIEEISDVACPAIDFVIQIAETSLEPIIEYGLGAVPIVKGVYSVYKRRQFERKISEVINELRLRQERIEKILKSKEERSEFGDKFINYLDLILFHDFEDKKIKYYIELLVTAYERKRYFSYEERSLNILMNLSLEELNTLFKIRNYVIKKLDVEHMVDIWALNELKRETGKNPFYNIIDDAWFGLREPQIAPNRNDIFHRLMSYGFIEPRYGYYGDELLIAKFVLNEETFKFCDFIEVYTGKREDSFLMLSGQGRIYTSNKYGKSVRMM